MSRPPAFCQPVLGDANEPSLVSLHPTIKEPVSQPELGTISHVFSPGWNPNKRKSQLIEASVPYGKRLQLDDIAAIPGFHIKENSHKSIRERNNFITGWLSATRLTLDLTENVKLSTMNERRDRFWQFVSEWGEEVSKDNAIVDGGFNREQAIQMTNFSFDEITGAGALSHITSLISCHTNRKNDEFPRPVPTWRKILTHDENHPTVLCQFFSTIPMKDDMTHSNSTLLKMLHLNAMKIDALNHFKMLKTQIHDPRANCAPI